MPGAQILDNVQLLDEAASPLKTGMLQRNVDDLQFRKSTGAKSIPTLINTTLLTSGSVPFATGAAGEITQDNANLFYDGTNHRLGLLTAAPATTLDVATKFQVDSNGNLVKINNVPYSWPAVQGGVGTILTNNGAGTLTWGAAGAGTVTTSGAPAATQVAFFTNGTIISGDNGLWWDNTNKRLGLGTITPATTLDTNGAATFHQYMDVFGIAQPAAPAAGICRLHAFTQNGFTRMEQDNEAPTNVTLGRDSVFIVRNTSGSGMVKGQVVYVTGSTGTVPNVSLARANSLSTLPSVGILLNTIANNNFGQVMLVGILANFNTTGFAVGDPLYVSSSTAGALTNVRPVSPNYAQRVGSVLDSAVNGTVLIDIAPFVGGLESGTTSAYTFSSTVSISSMTTGSVLFAGASGLLSQDNANFFWDSTNHRLGIGTTSPSYLLQLKTNAVNSQNFLLVQNSSNNTLIEGTTDGSGASSLNLRTGAGSAKISLNTAGDSWFIGGNVGIGTASPGQKLQVHGDPSAYAGYFRNLSSTAGTSNGMVIDAGTNSADDNLFCRNYDGTINFFVVNGLGQVGIGTTTPGTYDSTVTKLEVATTSGNAQVAINAPTGSASNLVFAVNGSELYRINVKFSTGFRITDNSNYAAFTVFGSSIILGYDTSIIGNLTVSGLSGGTSGRVVLADTAGLLSAPVSDARLKLDVQTVTDALDTVTALRGVSFKWDTANARVKNYGAGREVGLIAQEVAEVLPEAVFTNGDGYMGVHYDRLVSVLIEAVKEQQKQINKLKAQIN